MELCKQSGNLLQCGKSVKRNLGLALAAFIAGIALLGPPLTGQSVPALVGVRHQVSMLDRELDTVSGCEATTPFSGGVASAAKPAHETT